MTKSSTASILKRDFMKAHASDYLIKASKFHESPIIQCLKMNKAILCGFLSLLCLGLSIAAPADNSIETKSENQPEITEADLKPAQALITAIYQRAMVNALQTKVSELQQKISKGENAIPAAVDVLKITLLSSPTQDTIKKTAEQVLGEIKKVMPKVYDRPDKTTEPPKSTEVA